jgi:hypothetical protein
MDWLVGLLVGWVFSSPFLVFPFFSSFLSQVGELLQFQSLSPRSRRIMHHPDSPDTPDILNSPFRLSPLVLILLLPFVGNPI